jgi:hypothetical protein
MLNLRCIAHLSNQGLLPSHHLKKGERIRIAGLGISRRSKSASHRCVSHVRDWSPGRSLIHFPCVKSLAVAEGLRHGYPPELYRRELLVKVVRDLMRFDRGMPGLWPSNTLPSPKPV